MPSPSTHICSLKKQWLHTEKENNFKTGDREKVNKEWFDTIPHNQRNRWKWIQTNLLLNQRAEFIFTLKKGITENHCHGMF